MPSLRVISFTDQLVCLLISPLIILVRELTLVGPTTKSFNSTEVSGCSLLIESSAEMVKTKNSPARTGFLSTLACSWVAAQSGAAAISNKQHNNRITMIFRLLVDDVGSFVFVLLIAFYFLIRSQDHRELYAATG